MGMKLSYGGVAGHFRVCVIKYFRLFNPHIIQFGRFSDVM